jgi:mycothiol synthase
VTALDTPTLGVDALDAITALCDRSLARPILRSELAGALFAPDQPTIVRGDPSVGIIASVPGEHDGFIRLLVVDPAHRGNGHGHTLLSAAEADLAGCTVITVGADAPYYLFPGAETTEIELLSLLESRRYHREEANFNMEVDRTRLPQDPGDAVLGAPADRDEVARWMDEHWSNWKAEVLRALDHGTLLLVRDANAEIAGFCAWNVNRAGLLGPIASRPDLIGKGIGRPLLVSALHRMAAADPGPIEIAWVGPIVPYAAIGCRVSRVFFVYRKRRK